mgnify:CR=1 FL=1
MILMQGNSVVRTLGLICGPANRMRFSVLQRQIGATFWKNSTVTQRDIHILPYNNYITPRQKPTLYKFRSIRTISTSSISLHEHHHNHDSDFSGLTPEQASRNIYTIHKKPESNSTKAWNRVKDFFNPHKTMSEIMDHGYHSHSHESSAPSHSHSHNHSHISSQEAVELYDPKKLANKGVRITWIGFFVNFVMAITKLVGGVVFHSQSLVADSVHSFSDLISDVLTLSTVKYTTKKPNESYPLGYGKVETFGSLMVSAILLYAGLEIGFSSLFGIIGPYLSTATAKVMHALPFHDHGADLDDLGGSAVAESLQTADINAAWLALGSIVAKEWLFRATKKVGEEMNSKVLIANAWHHRVDSLTSVVALVTISAGYFLNIYWMDSVGGLLVALLVTRVGISGFFQSFKELIDKAMPRDDRRYMDIEDVVNVNLMKIDGNILIKQLDVMPSGTNMNVVLKLGVSEYNNKYESQLTLSKMGNVAEALRRNIIKDFHNVKSMSVQFISNDEAEEIPEDNRKENEEKEKKMEQEKEAKEAKDSDVSKTKKE